MKSKPPLSAIALRRHAEAALKTKQSKAVPARTVAKVDPVSFDSLAGTYQLAPGFDLKVWREGGRFLTQASGQSPAEIFPESETRYFLKVVDATLDFVKGADGRAEQLTLTQGGRKMPAKRVK